MQTPAIHLTNVRFQWPGGPPILHIPTFTCAAGDTVFLQGRSGSGKSTLLNIICGVFQADAGAVEVLGQPFHNLGGAARDQARANHIGVIFQQFNLVPFLTLVENVLLPCRFSRERGLRVGPSERARIDKAHALLERLGLGAEARADRNVNALSVGQQQRVAAARALIGAPDLIIADEPTSSLDPAAKSQFIHTLLAEAKTATVLFVSHDPSLSDAFQRQVTMDDINQAASLSPARERAGEGTNP